jgi:hypothetical protein
MRRILLAGLATLVLASGVSAERPFWIAPESSLKSLKIGSAKPSFVSYSLSDLVAMQKRSYAAAVVTSVFSDPRGVSRYRSVPGVHLGYDIAMPYGATVYCAWPGRVEAVIPWHGSEVGVKVRHSDGSCATYGHVHSLVRPGDEVQSGSPIASIASDHLDVKMRDRSDTPYDFGQGATVASVIAPDPRTQWLCAALRWQQLEERAVELEEQLAVVKKLGNPPKPKLEAIDVYLKEGILSEKQARAARIKHQQYQKTAAAEKQRRAELLAEHKKIRAEQQQVSLECRKLYRQGWASETKHRT